MRKTKNNFIKRYEELGQQYMPITLKPSLRVNTLKTSEQKIVRQLEKKGVKLEKISYLTNGYYYSANFSLGATQQYLQGHYYLQEAASQIPAQVLDPKPTDLVLDMAAAPGSKTTQLSQLMNNQGQIIAMDTSTKRLHSLKNNLERLSCSNVIIYQKDARHATDLGLEFDKILLDAPCTGNYLIDDDWFKKTTIDDLTRMARVQYQLINTAINCLKPKGILVYSTCSLEPEENEAVINKILKEHNITLLPFNSPGEQAITSFKDQDYDKQLKNAKRLWPWKTQTQGFFIAKIQKNKA
ncbi:RsmB/NOP family class I SAM-dependent RNA methyltransferase [Candidatus Woesearchaeota archaeon]|nr:RsmB/NOP family class I SAM-dependent RNA methyltransferase [Candidatus Woesearchaeota archaeon]